MANPQTAAEWKQVAANASAQIRALTAQQEAATKDATAAVAAAQAEYFNLRKAAEGKNFDLKTPEGLAALKEARAVAAAYKDNQLNAALEAQSNAELPYTIQINELRQTQSNADRQASTASSGVPDTQVNTAPANTDPGNNTTVTSTPPAVVENATVPATGQNDAAQAAFLEANASEQQLIDPNTDPNTNIGNDSQTLERPQPQQTISLNSDPNTNIGADVQVVTSPNSITENVFDPRQEVTESVFDPRQEVTESVFDPSSGGTGGYKGLQGAVNTTRGQQISQDAENAKTKGDWRVRLSLARSADYLYKASNPGILKYLQATDGVVFPYTPSIQITYAANYETADIVHSNYKLVQYKNSAVDQINITCDFTAQDTYEANYLLAVIHFFKSVTKMFYGRDEIPKPGTPPPLCYLSGLGSFQFDNHPLVISTFNYSLPNDVDYIRAGSPTLEPGVDSTAYNGSRGADNNIIQSRLNGLAPGAQASAPQFTKATNTQPTYVPTKMQIALTAYPMVTRNDISNNFSLKDYATGKLLQGSRNPGGGGIW